VWKKKKQAKEGDHEEGNTRLVITQNECGGETVNTEGPWNGKGGVQTGGSKCSNYIGGQVNWIWVVADRRPHKARADSPRNMKLLAGFGRMSMGFAKEGGGTGEGVQEKAEKP